MGATLRTTAIHNRRHRREKRAKLRSTALIEFEVKRDPNRGNGEIAKACRSSIPAVAKARKRLGYDEPVRA